MSEDIKQKLEDAANNLGGAGTADKIEGKLHEVAGQAKEAVGNLTGNEELKAEGEVEQAEGFGQQVLGDIKEAAENAVDHVVGGVRAVVDTVKDMVDGKPGQ